MTLTADAKKRVVLPGAVPGDVFTCEKISQGMLLRRILSPKGQKENDEKAGFGGYPSLEIHSGDDLGRAS